jgi:competence protein ComEC
MAAAALAAGDLLGLWTGGSEPNTDTPVWSVATEVAVIVLTLLVVARISLTLFDVARIARTGRAASPPGTNQPTTRAAASGGTSRIASPASILPAIGLVILAGLAIGWSEGRSAAGSCVAELRTGESLAARGMLLDPVPSLRAGEHARALTVRVGSSVVAREGRRCRVPYVRARVWPNETPLAAGTSVTLAGVWQPYPRSRSLPAAPDRYGYIQGRLLAAEPYRSASTGLDAATRLARLAARLREGAGRRLEASLAPDVVATGKALILADRATLDPAVRRRFTDAGIGHLLAISGLHIGALAGGALWCLGLWLKDWRRYPIAVGATGLYVLLIGAPPSAVRASLLFAGYAATRLRGAPASLGDLAGLAAVLALLRDPLVLLHPSFQLSFAGFAGIVTGRAAAKGLLRRIESRSDRRMNRRWHPAVIAFASSLAAFLFTAPFAAAHFGRIVPAAIFSSLLGSGLVALALPALILTLVLPGWMAGWAGAAATSALRLLGVLAERFAVLPLHWDTPPLGVVGWLVLGAIATSFVLLGARRRIAAIVVASSVCISWIAMPGLLRWRDHGTTLVCSLDVGQGDAAAVRTRRGRWILIDSGPGARFLGSTSASRRLRSDPRYGDAGRTTIVPFLRARGVRDVELLVLSHPHLDHFGGSAAVFDAFRVRRVLDPGFAEPNPAYLAFLDRVAEEGAHWLPARAGFRARVDEIELLVLWPPAGGTGGGANEHSAVLRLRAPGLGYLNTGDAPKAVEEAILARWPRDSVSAEILKLGHHGSRTSTSLAWLRTVRPAIAVISAGRANTHGHPHPITLARLDSARVPTVWRTDERGSFCVEAQAEGGWRVRNGR